MKRNHTNNRVQKNGTPPYTRAARSGCPKVASRYSPALEAWRSAMQNNRPDEATQHDRAWHRQYDPMTGGSKRRSPLDLSSLPIAA